MFCNACGKQIIDTARFCDACGKPVNLNAQSAPPPGQPGSGVDPQTFNPYRGRLIRPRVGRKVAGVCLAFANYLDVDVFVIRIVWLLAFFGYGFGFMAYLICWAVIDGEPEFIPAP